MILGINDCSHDAAIALIHDSDILFAGHSERYSRVKNDWQISNDLINDALTYGTPDFIAYYENRISKRIRRLIYGGINGEYNKLYKKNTDLLKGIREYQSDHHLSHACAGYYTSPFNEATVVVIDAIGEFETATIWYANGFSIEKKYSINYPASFGLFYSAYTQLLGLVPGTEEYILMGMAGFGSPGRYFSYINDSFPSFDSQSQNFHIGVNNFPFKIRSDQDKFDIAAAVQMVFENRLIEFMSFARNLTGCKNLVYMGGCALNCSANAKLIQHWNDIWIMPNPGDAGSSLGAALLYDQKHVNWNGPYLGYNIPGEYPVEKILAELKSKSVVAVASGRAEFGPRALGNRSILADPRDPGIKDKVNTVKKREMFRPFAPVVTEDAFRDWFDLDKPSPYMQYAVRCKRPEEIPSVVHVDGTSRVQTVNEQQHPGLYHTLKEWENHTGIPILLNTSLNIKGEPLINSEKDVIRWKKVNPHVRIV
jgi:carbamoyltransferase